MYDYFFKKTTCVMVVIYNEYYMIHPNRHFKGIR